MRNEKDKVNIVFLIDFLESKEGLTGGTERQLVELIGRLDRKRFHVCLFCLRQDQEAPIYKMLDCEKHILNIDSFKSISNIPLLFHFVGYLKNSKVDIVQAVFFDSILFGVIAAKLAGVKYILTCRRDMGFWYSKPLLRKLSFLNRLTNKILVNCNAVRQHVLEQENIPLDKIDVIYNGIDVKAVDTTPVCDLLSEFHQLQSNDRIVGMVANFNRKVKRVDLFIRALAVVLKQVENVKFLVIGDGNLRDGLMKLAQEIGVAKSLIWAGRKDDPLTYVKSFTIGVQSSDSEGLSNSILEYMAASLPVVATDTGGNSELIEDGRSGFLVPVNDHHALAEKISCLLADEQLTLSMGKRGRYIVQEKYSWDKKNQEYEHYYQSLFGTVS